MYSIAVQLLVVFSVFGMLHAGVKIEISRIKDPPKTIPLVENVVANESESEITTASTAATTMSSTESTVTTTLTTLSNVLKIENTTSNPKGSSTEATTISSQTVVGPVNPAQSNITNANTTVLNNINNVTAIIAKDLTPYLSEFTRRQMRRKLIPSDYYCPCDLKINFCDINCCCDVDCATREILQTLKCADRDWSIHDYEESSELQLCSQTRQFSLFCVVDNTRKRKQTRKRDFKLHEVNIMSVIQYKWPNRFDNKALAKNDYREHYIFGDPILAWDELSEEIQYLDVPWSFGAANCRIKNAVKHLVDDEIKCVQTLDEHDQFLADLQNRLRSVKILKSRKLADTPAIIMTDFCKSAQMTNETENCTTIEIYHCVETISLRNCKQDTNLTSSSAPEFADNFVSNELSIQIHHNFTNILNVTVFLVYHELNSESQPTHIVQKISVEYLELNETFATRDAYQVSGNIGYLHHSPIIVTKHIHQNQTTTDNTDKVDDILAYFHNETNCTNDDHYMKLPAIGANDDCVVNNYTFQRIDFGENVRMKCNVALTTIELNETDILSSETVPPEQNKTEICIVFQKKIIKYLLPHFELENPNSTTYSRFNNFVSEMGNPKNDTNYWHDFKTIRPPNLDEIVAVGGTNGASEFTCMNMVLAVRYEFFYGTALVGKVSNQPLIRVAQIQFGNRLNLKFKLDDDESKVPIYIDVMFYDFSRVGNGTQQVSYGLILLIVLIEILFI